MYYKNQLSRLKNSEYNKTVQFSDGQGNKTNNMDLNAESIDQIIAYLKKEKERLTNGEALTVATLLDELGQEISYGGKGD